MLLNSSKNSDKRGKINKQRKIFSDETTPSVGGCCEVRQNNNVMFWSVVIDTRHRGWDVGAMTRHIYH